MTKKKILRENPSAALHSFVTKYDTLPARTRKAIFNGEYKARVREENEALPRTNSWKDSTYDAKTYVESSQGLAKYS
jgi:hypothetical protein